MEHLQAPHRIGFAGKPPVAEARAALPAAPHPAAPARPRRRPSCGLDHGAAAAVAAAAALSAASLLRRLRPWLRLLRKLLLLLPLLLLLLLLQLLLHLLSERPLLWPRRVELQLRRLEQLALVPQLHQLRHHARVNARAAPMQLIGSLLLQHTQQCELQRGGVHQLLLLLLLLLLNKGVQLLPLVQHELRLTGVQLLCSLPGLDVLPLHVQ
jgi:hypothetical protein